MNIFITLGVRDGRIVTLYTNRDEKAILNETFAFSQRAPFGVYDMLGLLQIDAGLARQMTPLEVEYDVPPEPKPIGLRKVSL